MAQKQIELIEVVASKCAQGGWCATCPGYPWLTAEGATRKDVENSIASLAPELLKEAGVSFRYQLVWRIEREKE